MSPGSVLPAATLALSIVIPCYNEEAGLEELHRRVSLAATTEVGGAYEVILVNDGSTDGSWGALASLAERDRHVVCINLSRNHGHQMALSAGLGLCRGRRVLVLDADLQDPPELLPAMMQKMDEGFDVVYGQRQVRHGETLFKKASAKLFYRLLDKLSNVVIPRDTGDFRLMSRRVTEHLVAMPEQYRFIRGMVSWVGFRQAPLPYQREGRFAGETHYPLRKMIRLAIDAATSFSIVPLRFASMMGVLVGLMGLVALGFAILSWMTGTTIRGWTSLAAIVLIPSSIQLFMLGIFGEYLGRMYMENKRRPLYIIDEIRYGISDENVVHSWQERARAVHDL
jgi:polyisoprenyl-phosphate glycosyltransferase